MINTEKTVNGQALSYEIGTDGYDIYLEGKIWITQHGKYGKPVDKTKSYEANCLAQIEELTAVPEPEEPKYTLDEAAQIIASEVAQNE